ncbi:GTPase [Leptolyngbya sp. BC1307]|uniref:GTPase n=1 Tax=Leptolyngbya sp. BC1307 TaxID=2029589 RepID=UPI000EFD1EE9
MMRVKPWQVAVLIAPIAVIVVFLLIAAGQQIRAWGINWIWAVFIFVLVGWRWLVARWTRPAIAQAEALVSEVNAELEAATQQAVEAASEAQGPAAYPTSLQVEAALTQTLQAAKDDPPIWEDWTTFWQRCLALVTAVSQVYHPEVKRPLLNIYVPEAYGLIRGTVDDTDRVMQKLSPVLSQISVGQMVEGVEVYRKLEPSAKKLIKAFNWAQWLLNPAAAIARQTSARYTDQANQQILLNLGNMLRETALRNLAQQSVALYSGGTQATLSAVAADPVLPAAKTETLREILEQAEPTVTVEQKPVNILLVGRTGAGKSSVINTLFQAELAAVDVLPSTDKIQSYRWQAQASGNADEALTLWDTPGYEQVARPDLREQVIDYATQADLLLLVTPALDPALQMDADFLSEMRAEVTDLPVIAIVSQVDKLRPIREWSPPYQWRTGSWPKETAIRAAVEYRAEQLNEFCQQVLPLVARTGQRDAWGTDDLAAALMGAIAPAKQLRLARFLRSQSARTTAAAKIIDRYTFQMTTTEGLTKLFKSPILQFISTLTTGTPALGALLTERIPVEEVPIVLGKLQMAYELFTLFSEGDRRQAIGAASFDLLALWPLLLQNAPPADKNAWAFGHALTEYWTQHIPIDQLEKRIDFYLEQA